MPSAEDRFRPGSSGGEWPGDAPAGGEDPGAAPPPPQFGQRSPGWQPGPARPAEGRPWPVYDPHAGSQPAGNDWGPQPPTLGYSPPGYPAAGGSPALGTPGQLPSRTGPILTMIVGALLSLIVAPAVLFGLAMSGINMDAMADGSATVLNGAELTVDDSGVVGFVSQTSTPLESCTLTGGGQTVTIQQESDSGIVVGRGLQPGAYTVECAVPAGQPLFVFRGDELNQLTSSVMKGFAWSTVPGFGGFITFVVGLVWLVRRNRLRKDMTRQDWQWGGYPGPGYGGGPGPRGPGGFGP